MTNPWTELLESEALPKEVRNELLEIASGERPLAYLKDVEQRLNEIEDKYWSVEDVYTPDNDGVKLEQLIETLYDGEKCMANRVGGANDRGRDVVLEHKDSPPVEYSFIQAKNESPNTVISEKVIDRLHSAINTPVEPYEDNIIRKGILVSTAPLGSNAKERIEQINQSGKSPIEVVGIQELLFRLNKSNLTPSEFN